MTEEERGVVNPLMKWFKKQGKWELHKPKHGKSETGWDIQAQRKNEDLLIEAKFITGDFARAFSGLVMAPLTNRSQHFIKRKYRSWCHYICWAVGTSYPEGHIYQIFFNYLSRNIKFWKSYMKDLRLKYIFFIRNQKVAKIPFGKFINSAELYERKVIRKTQKQKMSIALELMSKYKYV